MRDRDEQSRAARRDLEKLKDQGGLISTPVMKAGARSLRDHFAARDAEESDRVELWGTRVGRGLSLVAFLVLSVWFVSYFFG